MLQLRIPPELKNVQKTVVPITGIDKAPHAENHDPSNVVRHGGKYYVWYTEHVPSDPEYSSCYIKYATSEDGLHWYVGGTAISKGGKGDPDEKGVLTPYVVHCDEKWYMLYLALDARFRGADDWQSQQRGIWIAEADSPDGPWRKVQDAPLLWPGSDGEWDELTCDNANPIFREGRWWLYYMGRKKGSHPFDSYIGLAMADQITGPYEKQRESPLMTGHAFVVWAHRSGVAAIGGEADQLDEQCVRWSEDGIHFVEAGHFENKSVGFFCPDNVNGGVSNCGVGWGFDVVRKITPRYIYRFDCTMKVGEDPDNSASK